MESRRRPRWPPPAHPKLLSVDGQSGLRCRMAFRPSEKSRDARKPNRCVLGLPLLRRPGSDPTILAPASSAPVPTPRNWPFRRSSRGLEARPTAASNETTWAVVPRSVPASMRGVLGLPATPAFMPRVRRLDRFSAQRTPSCARRALSPLCWCIFQAAIQYAAATRAVDAGRASWRNVGVSADNDCPGSRQSGRTIPPRHQGVTGRVFSEPLAAQGPDAAFAACHYPLPHVATDHRKGFS